jgi:hypothetical protein
MSPGGAARFIAAGFIEAGAGAEAAASKGGGVGAASGCAPEAVLAGGVAASLWTDSRAARFTLILLILLILSSSSRCHDVAAHKRKIINTYFSFKHLCALHKTREIAARCRNRRIAERHMPFAMSPAAIRRRIGSEAMALPTTSVGMVRSIQTKEICAFDGFSAFLYLLRDE